MNLQKIYNQVNDLTQRDFPQKALHEVISQQAIRTPDATAVLSGDQTQTYRQLDQRSNELANYLRSQGIGCGDLVGLCCNRDVDTPALLVGIMKSGAGYVPLDPDYPVDRLIYMVENSQVKHVVAHRNQSDLTDKFEIPVTVVDRDWDSVAAAGNQSIDVKIEPATDIAYVIYTSGSTGKPKGVQVQHRAAVNLLWGMLETPGFTSSDRILATTTLSFDISVAEMFLPLIVGGLSLILKFDMKGTDRI